MVTEPFRKEISTVAAAEKYQLTPSYIARLARTSTIRARKFGRDWIVDEQALQDYLAQPRRPGPKPRMMENQEGRNRSETPARSKPEEGHHAAEQEPGDPQTVSEQHPGMH